ncbi:hypothetical protein ACTJJ0_05270 [Chitinophaga sp. 22321]|uniref:Uncharacterized protein n=1 Tax=Chitinophaga hostae TaxID=2831022 RepID=A0ABS5IZF3_9BACT|nr:hypothetical protein [Chitinophaga hostae]MBS0028334.1 hypothetical protein [Chitinophaga hostae]
MDTNTPYDHLIAAKLEQIPVPDMADSIWASIETQLDTAIDVPDKKTAPKLKGKGWYGFAAITIAVTALWWYSSRPQKNIKPPQQQAPAPVITAPVTDSPVLIEHPEKKMIPVLPIPVKKDSASVSGSAPDSVHTADSTTERVLPLGKWEPRLGKPRPVVDSISVLPHPKKPKGVKGISPDDYKISADKDSARKKE